MVEAFDPFTDRGDDRRSHRGRARTSTTTRWHRGSPARRPRRAQHRRSLDRDRGQAVEIGELCRRVPDVRAIAVDEPRHAGQADLGCARPSSPTRGPGGHRLGRRPSLPPAGRVGAVPIASTWAARATLRWAQHAARATPPRVFAMQRTLSSPPHRPSFAPPAPPGCSPPPSPAGRALNGEPDDYKTCAEVACGASTAASAAATASAPATPATRATRTPAVRTRRPPSTTSVPRTAGRTPTAPRASATASSTTSTCAARTPAARPTEPLCDKTNYVRTPPTRPSRSACCSSSRSWLLTDDCDDGLDIERRLPAPRTATGRGPASIRRSAPPAAASTLTRSSTALRRPMDLLRRRVRRRHLGLQPRRHRRMRGAPRPACGPPGWLGISVSRPARLKAGEPAGWCAGPLLLPLNRRDASPSGGAALVSHGDVCGGLR